MVNIWIYFFIFLFISNIKQNIRILPYHGEDQRWLFKSVQSEKQHFGNQQEVFFRIGSIPMELNMIIEQRIAKISIINVSFVVIESIIKRRNQTWVFFIHIHNNNLFHVEFSFLGKKYSSSHHRMSNDRICCIRKI